MERASGTIIYRDHLNNHLVEVIEEGDDRSLYFAGHILQSTMSLSAPHRLVLSYTRYMMAALLYKVPQRVLIIGLGAGSLLRFLSHYFADCSIDAVDYSQHIIDLAGGCFGLPEGPNIAIHCCDGHEFLNGKNGSTHYDLILIDAFDENGMAPSIYCAAFFRLCRLALNPAGLVSANLWSGDKDRMHAVKQELGRHFSSIIELPVTGRGNEICLAGSNLELETITEPDQHELARLAARLNIDFKHIVKICRRRNLGLKERISLMFS